MLSLGCRGSLVGGKMLNAQVRPRFVDLSGFCGKLNPKARLATSIWKNMKPIAQWVDRRGGGDCSSRRQRCGRFPLIESNYQTFSLDRFSGGSTGSSPPSFLNISRDYFQREARRNFVAEVAFFLVLAAILAGALIEGAIAIIHFLHLPPA